MTVVLRQTPHSPGCRSWISRLPIWPTIARKSFMAVDRYSSVLMQPMVHCEPGHSGKLVHISPKVDGLLQQVHLASFRRNRLDIDQAAHGHPE